MQQVTVLNLVLFALFCTSVAEKVDTSPMLSANETAMARRQLQTSHRNGRSETIYIMEIAWENGGDISIHCTFQQAACSLLDAGDVLSTTISAATAIASCATPCVCCAFTTAWGKC
jgi:hypothetical protein